MNFFISLLSTYGQFSQARTFSCTSACSQRPDHFMFRLIDWVQVESGKYAVVDPLDSTNILYLSQREYVIQSRVVMSNDMTFVILATPRDKRPTSAASAPQSSTDPDNQNSPRATFRERQRHRRTHNLFVSSDRENRVGRLRSSFESILLKYTSTRVGSKKQLRTMTPGAGKSERSVPMIAFNHRNVGELILDWGSLLWYRFFGVKTSKAFSKALVVLGQHLAILVRHQGQLQTVLRLKVTLHCVLAYVAGSPMKTTESLGIRIKLIHGLPSSLPASTRQAIRSGNIAVLRVWISLLNMYRGLHAEHPPADIGAITAPRFDESKSVLFEQFKAFCLWAPFQVFKGLQKVREDPNKLIPTDPYASSKSGPNGQALFACRADLICWLLKGSWKLGYFADRKITSENSYVEFMDWFFYLQDMFDPVLRETELGAYIAEVDPEIFSMVRNMVQYFDIEIIGPQVANTDLKGLFELKWDYRDGLTKPRWAIQDGIYAPSLAKLIALYEPAGKVRNIVTFDWWSQLLFSPVHKILMELLRSLSSDATFDQDAAVNEFSKRGYKYIASLDLKSATEWIPQQLYHCIMSVIIGPVPAKLWLDLLSLREITPSEDFWVASRAWTVRYTRGQPMGALSSWSAMAIVHHMLVQFSAYLVGHFPFSDYLVLGDDIIIAEKEVAESYKYVCGDLGVKIGLPKSYISRKGFGNFAAQSFLGSVNISPVSISEELVIRGPAPRVEQALRFLRRGFWSLGDASWLSDLLKLMLHKTAYEQIISKRREGHLDPLVQVAFMAVFGVPERTKVHSAEIQGFSIRSFFGGLNLSMKFFSMPFMQAWGGLMDDSVQIKEMLISALLLKAKQLMKQFLPLDARLQELTSMLQQQPVTGSITAYPSDLFLPERQYLRHIILPYETFERSLKKMLSWERKYLDLVGACLGLETPFTDSNRAEEYIGIPLDVAYNGLLEAESELLVSLDSLLGKEVPVHEVDPDASVRSLDRLLQNFEHLSEVAQMPASALDPNEIPEDWLRNTFVFTKSH